MCVPGIGHLSVRFAQLCIYAGMFVLERIHQMHRIGTHRGVGVVCAEQQNVKLNYVGSLAFVLYSPICAKENDEVQRNDCDRDVGPAATTQIFMRYRNQHCRTPLF